MSDIRVLRDMPPTGRQLSSTCHERCLLHLSPILFFIIVVFPFLSDHALVNPHTCSYTRTNTNCRPSYPHSPLLSVASLSSSDRFSVFLQRHVHLLYEPDCCTSGFHSNSIVSCTDRLHITFNLDMLWISSIIFAILSILDNSPSSSLHVRHLSTAVFVTGHCCWQHWVIVSLGSGLTSPVCLLSS